MAATPGNTRPALPQAGNDCLLIRGSCTSEDRPDFEQSHIAESAIGIAFGRGDKPRQEARPHVGKIGGDRIGEHQSLVAAAEEQRLLVRDERPGDRLGEPVCGKRPLGAAHALLERR